MIENKFLNKFEFSSFEKLKKKYTFSTLCEGLENSLKIHVFWLWEIIKKFPFSGPWKKFDKLFKSFFWASKILEKIQILLVFRSLNKIKLFLFFEKFFTKLKIYEKSPYYLVFKGYWNFFLVLKNCRKKKNIFYSLGMLSKFLKKTSH